MPKDYGKLSRWDQIKQDRMMAKEMGIDLDQFQEADRGSQGNFDYDALRDAMLAKDNNNYSTRRSIEAAKLAGYEGADALSNSASNMEEFYKTRAFMQGIHENSLGNTGKYSYGGNDAAGVTKYLVDQDRINFKGAVPEPGKEDKDKEDEAPSFFEIKDPEREKVLKEIENTAYEFQFGKDKSDNKMEFQEYSDGQQYDARKNNVNDDIYDPDKDDEAQNFVNKFKQEVIDDIIKTT